MPKQKTVDAAANTGTPVLLVDGDKGGVGKSMVARAVAYDLLENGYSVTGIDGDPRNGHLNRFYGRDIDVIRTSVRAVEGWSCVIDRVAARPKGEVVITDLPAGAGDMLASQGERLRLGLDRGGRQAFRLWVIDEEDDSVALLAQSKDVIDLDRTLVVKNGRFGGSDDFLLWQESNIRTHLLRQGGAETYLAALPIRVRTRVRQARCSFREALKLDLTVSERIDLEIWLASLSRTFAPLRAWL